MEANKCLYEGKKLTSYQPQNPAQNRRCWKTKLQRRLVVRSQCAGHPLTNLIRVSEVDPGTGTVETPRWLQGASTGEKRGSSPTPNKTTLVESLNTRKIHLSGLLQQSVPSFQETFKARNFSASLVYWLTLIVLTGVKSPLVPQGDLLLKKIVCFFVL